ncbi:Uncharacterized protein TCM_021305 [Theobroma cacao]|uniref:Uncharacterized protein n=1 Tax=Theobroma cacao TaxID=3641 RepID=A0A061ENN5_THECC|nr:Uncharacterized protein TCM_021305 [Theobroma cacao]
MRNRLGKGVGTISQHLFFMGMIVRSPGRTSWMARRVMNSGIQPDLRLGWARISISSPCGQGQFKVKHAVLSLVKELKMGLGLQDFMAYAGFATTSMLPGEMVPNHKIVSAIDS